MIRIILLFLLMIARHRVSATSSTTKRIINNSNSNVNKYPRAISLKQFSSVLKFDRYERFVEQHELGILATNDESWESTVSSFWSGKGYSSSSKNVKNEAQQLHPFLLCHLDKTSTSGRQRYEIIKEEISKKENDSNDDFFMNELPVYNYNFDKNENQSQKQQQQHDVENESDEEEIPYGACFYGSMSYVVAKDIKGVNIFVTPMFTDLKIRRGASLMSNGDERTIAVSVQLSPGVATSPQQVMELAHTLVDVGKSILEDSSVRSCIESFQLLSSLSVTVNSIDISSFTYEVEKSIGNDNVITNECVMYFIEYLARQPQILSVERVSPTIMLNDVASWIIQGYPEENSSKPWFDIGITGDGEIVQLLDSGVDESHCYLRDASGKVPLTTDYDLTGGKIDLTKRKIVQYVAINNFNGDREDGTSHGTHVAATIAGKRSDDGVTETDGMVDGISPGVKLAFFDAHKHNIEDPNNEILGIPSDIHFLFYFGRKAGARIHSASWGVQVNGEYTERVRLIDTYFYDYDTDDEFIMFASSGNDGLEGSSTVFDPSLAKNVISVGASHSHGDDLSNNMLSMDYIAAFSSRGPTADGRIKPDIVAPGHSILSAAANTNGCDPAVRPKYEEQYQTSGGIMFMSGTSMSCPIAVGAGALVRQYFREVYDPSIDISGTLLKAVLVNGAEALVGRSKSIDGADFDTSTQYDEFQGYGKVNLMNSLKHPSPNIDSPDVHVEDARVLQQGRTHEYEFNVCDDREFRVTIAWKDPPNGAAGCQRCLVNDLDLEVELNEKIYYPNGRTNRDSRNNVERVIIDSSNLGETVYVRVKASNLGYGQVQKYSLASTGCINNDNFITPTSSPTTSCGQDQFEYVLEVFTDRAPEDTSWILEYQGYGGVINTGIAGEYDKKLNTYIEKGCARFDCFILVMRDSSFDGLCCSKGMGSYRITTGDKILVEGDSFRDRQEIKKFCHFGSFTEDPTASPTVVCNDDEFQYRIDIKTDLYPDETRWELFRKIDGVDEGSYTESYTDYVHEGCLDLGGCSSFFIHGRGEYSIKANGFVLAERENFEDGYYEEICYSEESNDSTTTFGIRTSAVGNNEGEKFDDVHPTWNYGKIVQIESYVYYSYICFIGITYEDGQLFEHGQKLGTQHVITLDEDQYITKVSGRSSDLIHQIIFKRNDGEIFGPYGYSGSSLYTPFEFDFGANALVYIFGRTDGYFDDFWGLTQLGFAHASLPQTITDSPTAQPTSFPCSDNQIRYEIKIRTDDEPEDTWWELHHPSLDDSVPFMTYRDQFESYSHIGCLIIGDIYEFRVYDKRKDGLCCYFGSGSYKLSVDNNVVIQGNNFDDAISVGYWWDPDYAYVNRHEFSYYSTLQPTSKPIELTCSDDEFEYRIRVRTDYYPGSTSWDFKYSNGTVIEKVDWNEYFLKYYEHNHRGCLDLDSCVIFTIFDSYGDGIESPGGYTVMANDIVMVEGGEWIGPSETKTFCYGPSVSLSPTSNPTVLFCGENKFKYKVIVTTDCCGGETSWDLSYDDGTIIDSVEEGYYTEDYTEHVHNGCLDLDSCVIFTIFDSNGDGICCFLGNGGYTIMANDVVMAEGGEFGDEETKTFCYGPSYSQSPSSSDVCENGSNDNFFCGYWASIGFCEDSGSQDWMWENCAKACSNCCIDYFDWCGSIASEGRCTDTSSSSYLNDVTMQDLMQGTCRVSCDTCDLDFTPSPTTTPVTCSDDQFKYEIHVTNDDYGYGFSWLLFYKYPDQYELPEEFDYDYLYYYIFQSHDIIDGVGEIYPPGYEKRYYGCASYSCFDLHVGTAYLKIYDKDKDILIAQNTERYEDLRFCHYAPEPTTSPITSSKEAIFTITLSFSTTSLHQEEIVSSVSHRSIQKILFHFIETNEYDPSIAVEYSFCEEFKCDVSFQVCKNESCNNNDEVLQPDFLAFIANSLKEAETNGLLLLTLKQTGHHMMVAEIFDNIKNDIIIEFDFDYEAWPTTSPTTSPSSTPEQNCNQNLFTKIAAIMQTFIQGINNTFTNVTNSISGELFGVDTVNSTADLIQCKDKMFWLQVEIQTDRTPNKTSWELLYENGTLIESIGRDTYSECNTTYKHSYCLDTSCFVFNLWDSFSFQGSYEITAGNSTLAQQDTFMWWKDTKRFCYPLCDVDYLFALQIDVVTDPWPHETSWQLAFENGTLVDRVAEGYYTGLNTSYSHRYCLKEGCYSVTFQDHIGDGMCCSYGDGSYMFKINDDEIAVKKGGKFEESETTTFCYPFDDASCKCCEEDTTISSLFGIIADLFGDGSCCTTDTTGYPTPVPSPFFSSQQTIQPSISSNPTVKPSLNPTTSLQPSSNPSSNPSISSIPSSHPSSNPSFIPTTSLQPSSNPSSNPSFIPTTTSHPSSNPSSFCNENEFKYEVVVTTDIYSFETSWELNYTNGTIIESVDRGEYAEGINLYVHKGCLDLDSCVIFTIFDYLSNGICCRFGIGGYTIMANDVVMTKGGEFDDEETKTFCYGPSYSQSPSILPSSNPSISSIPSSNPSLFCDENAFKYKVIVTTDFYAFETSWDLSYDDGTIIDNVAQGEYIDYYTEYVHEGCVDLDSCVIFTIFDSYGDGICCDWGDGRYTISANGDIMAKGGEFDGSETKTFCYGPSHSLQPSSNPTVLVCDEHEFKYEVVVTTDFYAFETSWDLSYDDGTMIDSVEEGEYTERYTEHVHEGCLDLDSCVIFTIEAAWYGLCCENGNGGYTIFADNVVMAEGGEFGDEETKTFCYGPSYSQSPSSSSLVCDENEFKYGVIVSTDYHPEETSWELIDDDGTIINNVEQGEYTDYYYEYVHEGCLDLDSCVIFTIFDLYYDGICCYSGHGGYTLIANDDIMAEGGEWIGPSETKTFCYDPSSSFSPTSLPTFSPSSLPTSSSHPSSSPLVCDENEFKYEVVVTTDFYPEETSWELSYDGGTIIDGVAQGYYTEDYTEHVHNGCLDLDSCVIFTIFDSYGDGIESPGGYTVMANDDIMAEGGEFGDEETKTFCYDPSSSFSPSSSDVCENGSNNHIDCGWWASIGDCENPDYQYWMQENCAKACSNCCADYHDDCEILASGGYCTDTTTIGDTGITWQEYMKASCRVSCDTCDLFDYTLSRTFSDPDI